MHGENVASDSLEDAMFNGTRTIGFKDKDFTARTLMKKKNKNDMSWSVIQNYTSADTSFVILIRSTRMNFQCIQMLTSVQSNEIGFIFEVADVQ